MKSNGRGHEKFGGSLVYLQRILNNIESDRLTTALTHDTIVGLVGVLVAS